jgi:hypothetical protein
MEELGDDIRAKGLLQPIVLWRDADGGYLLLDGRNRLDAMEKVGLKVVKNPKATDVMRVFADVSMTIIEPPADPYDYVISANVRRRHLTMEQKRDLIVRLLKCRPDKSDRQIAKQVGASPTTVGSTRKELENAGGVSKLDTRTDAQGRQQAAHKPRPTKPPVAPSIDTPSPGPPSDVPIYAVLTTSKPEVITRIMGAADVKYPPPLPPPYKPEPSSRLDPAILRLRAIQRQVEAEQLPLDLLQSDDRRQRLTDIWTEVTARLSEAVTLVEAERDEQHAAEQAAATETPPQNGDVASSGIVPNVEPSTKLRLFSAQTTSLS